MADTIYKLLDTSTNVDDATRTIEVICSTSSPDRIGDVIVQEGIDTTNYRKNPVVLWGHDADRPVARAGNVFLQNGQLRAVAEFPPEGKDADADWVYSKVKNRLVNAVSIGFIPKEWEPVDPKSPWDGYKFLESEMVEFSFVSVPMNAEALVVGRSLMPPRKREFTLPSKRKAANEDGDDAEPDEDPDDEKAGGWKVGAARSLPIDDSDSWDGPAAAASMFEAANMDGDSPDLAKVRRGFLIYDTSKPEQKGSYKLPFAHVVDGTLKAVKGGIRAAASRLRQTDAPSAVLDRAQSVIDHYEEKMGIGSDDGKALVAAMRRALSALDESLMRIQKAGRTLSQANEARLRAAHSSIGEVLDQLPAADEPDADDGSKSLGANETRPRQAGDPEQSSTTQSPSQQFPRREARRLRLLKLRSA